MAKEYFYQEDAFLSRAFVPNKIDNSRTLKFGNNDRLHPRIQAKVDELHSKGWRFFVADHTSSWAQRTTKVIVICLSHWHSDHDYYNYVVAHECAHAQNWEDGLVNENHGPKFMAALIQICPDEWLHYEIGYKPRNATAAGITTNGYVKPLPKKLTLDDL